MLETFIIDGVRTEIIVQRKSSKAELIEVTSFLDKQRGYIHSGFHFLKLEGKTISGNEINNIYQVIDKREDILEIKTLADEHDLKFRVK